uniref:Chromatin assembly factor 1 subunit A n=1 Tax=Syphacia muris TaxID=451379 RepID=A0A158R3X3_9BILA
MSGTCEAVDSPGDRILKRPPDDCGDENSSNKKFRPSELKVDGDCLLKDCVNIPEAAGVSPTSEVSAVLNEAVVEVLLSDDDGDVGNKHQPQTPTLNNVKDKKPSSSHKKKLTEEERLAREEERRRKAEEKRIKMEMAAAAKQLRQKQKDEAAEARRLEKEKKEKEREEHRRKLEEKRKVEEELKRKRELKRKEDEERREQKRREEEERREQKRLEDEEKRERKKREEEAEELRKKRISNYFMSFFSKKERTSQPVLFPVQGPFRPFEIKEGMTVAPIHRRAALTPKEYECLLTASIVSSCKYTGNVELLFISNIYKNIFKFASHSIVKIFQDVPYLSKLPCTSRPNSRSLLLKFGVEFWNYLIFRYCRRNPMKAKLFQFHDNYRPPYYGTWRKRSECIKGRRPFAKDTNILDYEVDSDEEWEEDDGDADDCDKDDFDEEEKEEIEEEDEDGFFVEHGYLSAGEGDEDDEPEEIADDRGRISDASDAILRQNRLKAKAAEWKENLDQKFVRIKKLRPTLYGPIFCSSVPVPKPPFLEPVILFD